MKGELGFESITDCTRSRKLAWKLNNLSEFNLPKNFIAWLVGIRTVHLLIIILEFKGQLRHGVAVMGGRG